jgi:hypothetical protein
MQRLAQKDSILNLPTTKVKSMNIRNFNKGYYAFLFIVLLGTSCQQEASKTNTAEEFVPDSSLLVKDGFSDTFYRIPSPEDMFEMVSKGKLVFKADVLNPATNLSKYNSTQSKEFNFGVYSADLAYTAAFQKYQEAYEYIETVRKLSNDIGISSVFDEALVARVHNIFANSDSLIKVTNTTYTRFVRQLEQNERGKTLALISAGGWVESLYIMVGVVGDYKANDPNIQRIADQKLTFENLIEYLLQFKDDESVSKLISELSSIKLAYDQIQETAVKRSETKRDSSQIVVGASKKITIDQAQYNGLRTAIQSVRNKLTQN